MRIIIYTIIALFLTACNSNNAQRNPEPQLMPDKNDQKTTRNDFVHQVKDIEIFNRIVSQNSNLKDKNMNEVMAETGQILIGTPYTAHTLESNNGNEQLTINLRELDCVTFVENALALSYCIKEGKNRIEDFADVIEHIRYRNGRVTNYTSRLHYATEWLIDNKKKGVIKDVSVDLGGVIDKRPVNFMSTHTDAYQAFAVDTSLIGKMAQIEKAVSLHERIYVPKNNIKDIEKQIESGDILMLTTTIEGLDVSHFGMALQQNNRLHLLHASPGKGVVVSKKPLHDYMAEKKLLSGIIVCKPLYNDLDL